MFQNQLSMIIERQMFEHYCQPICDLKGQLQNGRELLLRAQFGTPDIIFHQAKKINRLYELDTISILKAFESKQAFQDQIFFLNVFPSTIKNPLFPGFIEYILKDIPLKNEQIVFELNEGEAVFDVSLLKERINWLREFGFLIALDDVGKGAMTLASLIELSVDYIKLDRYFSKDLHTSPKKQSMIKAIIHYCHANQIKVVLEGIEDAEALLVANELGVDMGQGYYLGRPKKMSVYT